MLAAGCTASTEPLDVTRAVPVSAGVLVFLAARVTIMADFVTRNRPDWDELEQLLARGRRSVGRLSPEELNRLDVLYRRVAVHLAQVRTRTRDERLAAYLNQLAAAAHTLIYLPPRQGLLKRMALFAVLGFAECVARNWRMHAISAGLLVAGAVLAYHAASNDVLAAYALALPGDARLPGTPPERLLQYLRQGRDLESGGKSFFASFLFSHNLKVGLLSMGLGVLAGVPTVILTLYNGMMVGTFLSLYFKAGLGVEFCAWILPHGITELSAIVLCGGAGLVLARAVVSPGLQTRAEALVDAGAEAARTAVGIAGMLAMAAFIESFVRQSHLTTNERFVYAGLTGLFWTVYFAQGFLWRTTRDDPSLAEATAKAT
jgi:uncharacterized membrane protein SpoIIM required for sporulation